MAHTYFVRDQDKELLELLAAGHTSFEIGQIMFLSERTIDGRVEKLKFELDAKSRANMVSIAYEDGYLVLKIKPKHWRDEPATKPLNHENH